MTSETDSWNEWARYVLEELKSLRNTSTDLSKDLKSTEQRIQDRLMQVQLDVNTLKVKAALFGAMIGAIIGFICSQLVSLLFNRL